MPVIETSLILSIVSIAGTLGNTCLSVCMRKECYISGCCVIKNDSEDDKRNVSVDEIVESVIDRSARSKSSIEELKKISSPTRRRSVSESGRTAHALNI